MENVPPFKHRSSCSVARPRPPFVFDVCTYVNTYLLLRVRTPAARLYSLSLFYSAQSFPKMGETFITDSYVRCRQGGKFEAANKDTRCQTRDFRAPYRSPWVKFHITTYPYLRVHGG